MSGRTFASVRLSRKLSSYVLRTPLFSLRTELLLTLLFMAIMILVQTARAENETGDKFKVCTDANASWDCLAQDSSTKSRTTTTTITTTTSEGTAPSPAQTQTPAPAPEATRDFVITAKFGSKATSGMAGCKTQDQADDIVRKLKAECSKWMNERKAELKSKYQTGTCEEECSDCGMSLQRCSVNGAVHYSK